MYRELIQIYRLMSAIFDFVVNIDGYFIHVTVVLFQ